MAEAGSCNQSHGSRQRGQLVTMGPRKLSEEGRLRLNGDGLAYARLRA
jgi:hypothetical protein